MLNVSFVGLGIGRLVVDYFQTFRNLGALALRLLLNPLALNLPHITEAQLTLINLTGNPTDKRVTGFNVRMHETWCLVRKASAMSPN